MIHKEGSFLTDLCNGLIISLAIWIVIGALLYYFLSKRKSLKVQKKEQALPKKAFLLYFT
ncbi:hypothetical protein [Bacillus sp. FJAT-44742]|uniref:hypothetical protein n=1 Tax=Bacillus sp. FJAT-44742 TaxID=2014005 RepID=UPI000C236E43|nr:hypothetical protein [Bacillus sp. FJAT-44742]